MLVVTAGVALASGAIAFYTNTPSGGSYQHDVLLAATTTNATSTNVAGGGGYSVIAGAKRVTMYFGRGGVVQPNLGSTRFSVQVTPNGTDWYNFGRLILGTSTTQGAQDSIIVSGTSTVQASLDLRTDTFDGVRCIALETTDGEHTCSAAIEF